MLALSRGVECQYDPAWTCPVEVGHLRPDSWSVRIFSNQLALFIGEPSEPVVNEE